MLTSPGRVQQTAKTCRFAVVRNTTKSEGTNIYPSCKPYAARLQLPTPPGAASECRLA